MSFNDCIANIRTAAGRDLTDDQIEELAEEVERLIKRRRAEDTLDGFDERLRQAADEVAARWEAAAYQEKRQQAINRTREVELLAQVRRVSDRALGLESVMVGINRPVEGGRMSADARSKSIEMQMLGGMVADLERDGLMPHFTSRHLEREIARELWEIGQERGRPGVTGSKEARGIAEIIHKYQTAVVERQNRAGAWIVPRPGYIVRQTHDPGRIRRAGFEEWKQAILPLLDADETFQGADPEKFLRGAYDGLVTGRHGRAQGAAEADDSGFRMPPNLANKVSAERVLHFKSANAWMDYNERFGTGSLTESVFWGLRRAAQNAALMEVFGPNPGAMFQRVRNQILDEVRQDPKMFDRVRDKRLDNQFSEITGEVNIPENITLARIGAGVRAQQSMSKLGGALLSSITDIPFTASELSYQGVNLLSAYRNAFDSVLRGRGKGEQRQIAQLIGAGMEGMTGEVMARFSAQDHIPGRMAKLQTTFFRLNGLAWWTDSHKTGAAMMLSRWLAMHADRPLTELPKRLSRALRQYGIDDATWDAVRVQEMSRGREADDLYLTPDMARRIPDEQIAATIEGKVSPRRIEERRQEIETAIRAYFVDRADFAVPSPGSREQGIMKRGTRPGTPEGEALRFFWQFKAFPVTVITKVLGRSVYGTGAHTLRQALLQGKGDLLGLTHLMVMSTVFGYLAMSAKDLAKGRTPRDPERPATWAAAFTQGGGAGIYGDFLFGDFNRFGGGLAETLAGPTAGAAGDFARVWSTLRTEGPSEASAGFFRFLVSNAPFANLFYTRIALDYLFLYQVTEMLNPGYLRRMERRVQEQNNQTFLLRPAAAIPRGGGDRLLEGVRE